MHYTIKKQAPIRALISEQMNLAREKNNIHGLFELDITFLKSKISEHRQNGHLFSFPAYIMFVLGQTLNDYKEVLDMRWGSKKIVHFSQIDLFTIVERRVKGEQSVPMALIIRDLGSKTLDEISSELRKAQKADPLSIPGVKERRRLLKFPGFIRRYILRKQHENPTKFVKYFGNVVVSSLNFFSDSRVWHGIPLSAAPLSLVPSGTYKKVVFVNGEIAERDFSSFTFSVNHDLNDGSPAVRFAKEFAMKLEGAYGL